MSRILLATCTDLPDGDEDGEVLVAALLRAGTQPEWASWTDVGIDWDAALVVLRSTWDYTPRRAEFLDWLRGLRRVANEYAAVEWSSDKTYLRDLAAAGVAVTETAFVAPGAAVPDDLPAGELVVKPSVGAGSKGAGRFPAGQRDAVAGHVATLHAAGRTAMIQPYLSGVDTAGETALVYVDGRFSHAVRKGPMLPEGMTHGIEGRSLFVREEMRPREPSAAELAVGGSAVTAVRERFGRDQLYTRVDLLPAPDGPVVVELELVEPSLFLQYADGAPDRFASAVAARA